MPRKPTEKVTKGDRPKVQIHVHIVMYIFAQDISHLVKSKREKKKTHQIFRYTYELAFMFFLKIKNN